MARFINSVTVATILAGVLTHSADAMEPESGPPGWHRIAVACFVYKDEKGLLGGFLNTLSSPFKSKKGADPATSEKKESYVQESAVPEIESQLNQYISKYTASSFRRLRSGSKDARQSALDFRAKKGDCRKKRKLDYAEELRDARTDAILYGILDYDVEQGAIIGTAYLYNRDFSEPVKLAVAQTSRGIAVLLRSISTAIARELYNGLDARNHWRLPDLPGAQGNALRLMAAGSSHVRLTLDGVDVLENRQIALVYYRLAHKLVESNPAQWGKPEPGSEWGQVKSTLAIELARQQRPLEALDVFEPIGNTHPAAADIFTAIGDSFLDEGDYGSALEVFKRAASLPGAPENLYLKLASTRLAAPPTRANQQYDVSIDLENYFAGDICNITKMQEVVSLLMLRGLRDEARRWLNRVPRECEYGSESSDPEYDLYFRAVLGDQANNVGDRDTAIWFYRRAIDVTPPLHGARTNTILSRVHYNLGTLSAEKPVPDFEVILAHYGEALKHEQEIEETGPYFYASFRASLLLNYWEALLLEDSADLESLPQANREIPHIADALSDCLLRHAECDLGGVAIFAEHYLLNLGLVLRGDRPQVEKIFFDALTSRGDDGPDRIYWDFDLVTRILNTREANVCDRRLPEQCQRTRDAQRLTRSFARWRSEKLETAER